MSWFNPFKKRSKVVSNSPILIFSKPTGTEQLGVSPQDALHNSDIFAVMNRISTDVAKCPLTAPAPYNKVLRQPNKLMGGFNYWQQVVMSLLLYGNSVEVINYDGKHAVCGLEHIPYDQVVITLEDGSEEMTYEVTYNDDRPPRKYNSAEVLHFKLVAPATSDQNQYIGMSPLEALTKDFQMQENSKGLMADTLKHALAPTQALVIPAGPLNADAKENIRKQFEKQNAGDNRGRVMVLDQGADLKTMSIDPNIANFLNNYNFSQTQIAKTFGVPDSYLNGTGDQQSNIDQIAKLYNSGLAIYIQPILSELSLKFGVDVKVDNRKLLDPSGQQMIDNLIKLTTTSNPVYTPEEAQQILADHDVFNNEQN